jgi:hypothetical protein
VPILASTGSSVKAEGRLAFIESKEYTKSYVNLNWTKKEEETGFYLLWGMDIFIDMPDVYRGMKIAVHKA